MSLRRRGGFKSRLKQYFSDIYLKTGNVELLMSSATTISYDRAQHGNTLGKKRISARSRNFNIAIFALALCIAAAVMVAVFTNMINTLSSGFTERYAASTAGALNAHIGKEIGLLSKAARSNAVTEWMLDEEDAYKKAFAFEEMAGIVGELYSFNLYIGLEKSLREYRVEDSRGIGDLQYFAALANSNPEDAWYFNCVKSDADYEICVGIDHVMGRKRVWLNYRVAKDGEALGVICTGLEFSHIAGELFSKYDENNMRGIVFDDKGIVHMDSALMNDRGFLYDEYETKMEDIYAEPAFLAAIDAYLNNGGYNAGETGGQGILELPKGLYRYASIAPIGYTNWSVVILSGTPSLFDISLFIPVCLTMLILLVVFALVANAVNYRLIFMPLGRLDQSLALLKDNNRIQIYGVERDDELGELSKTIQDLFNKANVDTLTGIYNRRFMENNLVHIMEMLSRSYGMLSMLMMDIDNFKKYNDTYGHEQGDMCLRSVARAIAVGVTRANDFSVRYGGEEFVAVLPNTDEAGARVVAEKLLESVRGLNIPHSGNTAAPCVTISIGVTAGRVSYKQSWEAYIRQADKALYASKQNGRNRYTFFAFPEKPA